MLPAIHANFYFFLESFSLYCIQIAAELHILLNYCTNNKRDCHFLAYCHCSLFLQIFSKSVFVRRNCKLSSWRSRGNSSNWRPRTCSNLPRNPPNPNQEAGGQGGKRRIAQGTFTARGRGTERTSPWVGRREEGGSERLEERERGRGGRDEERKEEGRRRSEIRGVCLVQWFFFSARTDLPKRNCKPTL